MPTQFDPRFQPRRYAVSPFGVQGWDPNQSWNEPVLSVDQNPFDAVLAPQWSGRDQIYDFQIPHYDPSLFTPQGRPAPTPGANPMVAAQSQVVYTPEEIRGFFDQTVGNLGLAADDMRAQQEAQQAAIQQQLDEAQRIQGVLDAYQGGLGGNVFAQILGALGGAQALIPLSQTGIGSGEDLPGYYYAPLEPSVALPEEFQGVEGWTDYGGYDPNLPEEWRTNPRGIGADWYRVPTANAQYANQLVNQLEAAIQSGGNISDLTAQITSLFPGTPPPPLPSFSLPFTPGVMQPSLLDPPPTPPAALPASISQAIANYQQAVADYNALGQTDAYNAARHVTPSLQAIAGYLSPQEIAALQPDMQAGFAAQDQAYNDALASLYNDYNNYVGQYWQNAATEGQAYQSMMGGGYQGGVLPYNPQWYDTTPAFQPTQPITEQEGQVQAQQSPWGQPGAPWQSQAWASGTLQGPQPVGGAQFVGGQFSPQVQQPTWTGTSGMFSPQQFDPSLAINPPWQTPQSQQVQAPQQQTSSWATLQNSPQQQQQQQQGGQWQGTGWTNRSQPMAFGQSPWGNLWG